jgi:hypothetical protein
MFNTHLSSTTRLVLRRFWLFSRSPRIVMCCGGTFPVISIPLFMEYSNSRAAFSMIPLTVKPLVSISSSSPASLCLRCSLKASLRKLEPLRQPCNCQFLFVRHEYFSLPSAGTNSFDSLNGDSLSTLYVVASTVPPPASRSKNASPCCTVQTCVSFMIQQEMDLIITHRNSVSLPTLT